MVRTADLSDAVRTTVTTVPCPSFETTPWSTPVPAAMRKVAVVSSAGLSLRGQQPFRGGEAGYRDIPHNASPADVLMSHISVNYDRTGFQLDPEVAIPRRRLDELVDEGVIGAVADTHYSFMGATDPLAMEDDARALAARLREHGVNTVALIPV
jgi:D-proline reductase (dithiol) PrdB